jgi:cytoskeletal protein CcmA (bactofilin family)
VFVPEGKPSDLKSSTSDPISSKQEDSPMSDPYAGATAISKDGTIILYLRGDEIVEDGSIVGNFDGDQVRKDGSIVGEIRGDVFRHEGSEVWKLDKGNLYSGIEIRLEGSIIGDIRSDGTIWQEGSSWGTVKPCEARVYCSVLLAPYNSTSSAPARPFLLAGKNAGRILFSEKLGSPITRTARVPA